MLEQLITYLKPLPAIRQVARGVDWLLGVSPAAGLLTRIVTCVREKTAVCNLSSALYILMLLFVFSPLSSRAATLVGTVITNTAYANFQISGVPASASGAVSVTTVMAQTPATIELLRHDPSVTSGNTIISATQCGSPSVALPSPIVPGVTSALPLPSAQPLGTASTYGRKEPVFIRIKDADQNVNPLLAETMLTTVTTSGGDSEILTLTETGISTGVFVGYIQTYNAPITPNNCQLNITANDTVTAKYFDGVSGSTLIAAAALIDPFGVFFDSATGLPVNGATITIINVATGLAASVFGNDGVSAYPSTIISGGSVTDAGGEVYNFAPGNYQFPRLAPGTYRFLITPPAGYSFASVVPNATLQTLPGAPFIVVVGSRGEPFTLVAGPALRIDIPLDPASGELKITKTAGKSITAIGEFVPYSLSILNSGVVAAVNVQMSDRLPLGFRYQAGSAKLNGVAIANPNIAADAQTLTFNIGNIAAGATVTLKYVAMVSAGAKTGNAENTAASLAPNKSNTARASVFVRNDLFREQAILMGRVIIGSCDDRVDNDDKGLKNARVMLQDGRYVQTDADGRWHMENIRPGTHVVQLDIGSLPADYEAVACEQNTRFAGRSFSQFVNVRGGTLWRADFHVQKKPENSATQPAGTSAPEASAEKSSLVTPNQAAIAKTQLVEKLPYDDKWLATAEPGFEWLHPQASFQPALPVIKVAVKAVPGQVLSLKVNGAIVSPLNYDGAQNNAANTVSLSVWSGLPITEGKNTLELIVSDAQGKEINRQTRIVQYASGPVRTVLVIEQSRLLADGKIRPMIAVRFLDKDGLPARRGINGDFQINAPYSAWDKQEGLERAPLTGRINNKPRFEIAADGTALIELLPTTQSGEAVLTFQFADRKPQEIRAWLKPGERDWVLVGFAEGTVGHKQLSGNKGALKQANADEKLYDENRIAFYAKGMVKGDFLLTIAYDTAKQRGDGGSTLRNLKQAVDPNQFYTLYGDATSPQFDAASARKLYVKIERNQFYAMFGDYDTGLSVTEFARYNRTLNGVKSEYQGKKIGYSAFAASTDQAFIKDEIPGVGTSGLYRLSRTDIIINSDKIRVESRDRFHNEVIINTRNLTRYLDYDIDYNAGTVFFREPIVGRDENFNPIYIVAEYESEASTDNKMTYGGRVAVKPTDQLEIGVTHIKEGNIGASGKLSGSDATLQISEKTKLTAEFATSDRDNAGVKSNGSAWKTEITHEDEKFSGKAYAREQDGGFGLGQQAGSENGTRKMGADVRLKLTQTLQLQGEAYRQDTLGTDAQRDVAEGRVEWHKDDLATHAGIRLARDEDGANVRRDSRQVIVGASYLMLDKKLVLRSTAEIDLSGSNGESFDFPNRYKLGLDYKLTEQTTLFVEQEFARGEKLSADITRLGLRTKPWSGGELAAALGNDLNNDAGRLFANIGLTQKWQINEAWAMDVGVDRVKTLNSKEVVPQNLNVPLTSGTLNGDYTALYTGINYTNQLWSANSRIEWRAGETDDKINLMSGVQRNLDNGKSVAAGFTFSRNESAADTLNSRLDTRLSFASRPIDSEWILLDRFDYITELNDDGTGKISSRKLVNNLNANWMPNRRTQIAMQYGAKYVIDTIDGTRYSGFTDLMGAELRRDINKDWDIGLHADLLHSWKGGQYDYSMGASVGYKVYDNSWVSVGYNWLGFSDNDFSGADYRVKGLYGTLRIKFDQDTLGLNKAKSNVTQKP